MTRTRRSEAYERRVARRRQCKLQARARRGRKRKLRALQTVKRYREDGYTEPEQGDESG